MTWKEDGEKVLECRHRCFEGMACRIAIINVNVANEYTLCKFSLHPMPRFNETCRQSQLDSLSTHVQVTCYHHHSNYYATLLAARANSTISRAVVTTATNTMNNKIISPPKDSTRLGILIRYLLLPILLSVLLPRVQYIGHFISSSSSPTVDLTRNLISIPSSNGNDHIIFKYTQKYLHSNNFNTTLYPIPSLSSNLPTRYNLVATHPSSTPSDLLILLTTHLDTVPGSGIPLNTTHTSIPSSTYLHGRGSVDAKGQAAAMIQAFCQLRHPSVGLLLVTGEETDHAGMLHAHNYGFGPINIINGEPTEGHIATRQKGMLNIRLIAIGKAAHSGYPHLGVSAVHRLLTVLNELNMISWDDGVSYNIGTIQGGSAANVLAEKATAQVMFRVPRQWQKIYDVVKQVVEKVDGVTLEILTKNDALEFFVPKSVAKIVGTTVVAYNTDVPYYQGKVKKVVLFGAGSIAQAHRDHEWVEVKELNKLPGLYIQIVEELLAEEKREREEIDV